MKDELIIVCASVFTLPWLVSLWVGRCLRIEFTQTEKYPNRHFNSSAIGGALCYELFWILSAFFGATVGSLTASSGWPVFAAFLGLIPAGIQRYHAPY